MKTFTTYSKSFHFVLYFPFFGINEFPSAGN